MLDVMPLRGIMAECAKSTISLWQLDQEKSKARCEMRAIETVGSGVFKANDRIDYTNACLTSEGFVQMLVQDSE